MDRVRVGAASLAFPDRWTLSTMIFAGPTDHPHQQDANPDGEIRPFQQNLIATFERVDADTRAEDYVDRQQQGLREAGVDSGLVGGIRNVDLDSGGEGVMIEQVVIAPTGEYVRQLQLVTVKESLAATVIVSHLDGEPFEAARAEFEAILLSFAW